MALTDTQKRILAEQLAINPSYEYDRHNGKPQDWGGSIISIAAAIADPPTNVVATSGGVTSIAVTWVEPTKNGGSAITAYNMVAVDQVTGTQSTVAAGGAGTTSGTITGLTPGHHYKVWVLAQNAQGNSYPSNFSLADTAFTSVPGPPTSVSATGGAAQATVNWLAPASNGNSAITNYIITPYLSGVAKTPVTVGNVLTTTVSGLTAGSYTFTAIAVNALGNSQESAASSAVTVTSGGSAAAIRGSAHKSASARTLTIAQADFNVAPQNGDMLIAFVTYNTAFGGTSTTSALTLPTGWTAEGTPGNIGSGAGSTTNEVFYKTAGSSEGSYVFAGNDTGTQNLNSFSVSIVAVSGSTGNLLFSSWGSDTSVPNPPTPVKTTDIVLYGFGVGQMDSNTSFGNNSTTDAPPTSFAAISGYTALGYSKASTLSTNGSAGGAGIQYKAAGSTSQLPSTVTQPVATGGVNYDNFAPNFFPKFVIVKSAV